MRGARIMAFSRSRKKVPCNERAVQEEDEEEDVEAVHGGTVKLSQRAAEERAKIERREDACRDEGEGGESAGKAVRLEGTSAKSRRKVEVDSTTYENEKSVGRVRKTSDAQRKNEMQGKAQRQSESVDREKDTHTREVEWEREETELEKNGTNDEQRKKNDSSKNSKEKCSKDKTQ